MKQTPKQMNISYLILAHNNFVHLSRLIDALDDGNSSFYIHIDAKTEEEYNNPKENVFVIPRHFDINWGGYNMIEATLELIRYAHTHNMNSDYFVFISGVDYPVRSRQFLYKQLEEGKEYIDIAPMPIPYKPMERFEYYYFEYDRRNMSHLNPKFLIEVLLKKLKIKRKIPFRLYVGTQWFALTRKCVKYILKTVDTDKSYEAFFRHALVPDEAFFQTIIGNSPFLANAAASLTYTDWNVPVPPATIEDRHVDFLKDHIEFDDEYGHRLPYFARKFNDDSKSVLARIRIELWK